MTMAPVSVTPASCPADLEVGPSPEGRSYTVSVVVPAYNEADILDQNLLVLYRHLARLAPEFRCELVIVDDGSSDDTGAIAESFAATHPGVRVLHHHTNFRLGQALRYAFGTCTGDYVVVMDCDLTYAPDHVDRMLRAIVKTKAKIVIASPYVEGGRTSGIPFGRRVASLWANKFLSYAAQGQISTITGMVRAYETTFLRSLHLKAMDAEINPEIIYKAQVLRAKIVEVPAHLDWSGIDAHSRGKSSKAMRRATMSALVSGFMFRPFRFFILPGVVLGLGALWSLAWMVWRVAGAWHLVSPGGIDPADAIAVAYQQAPYGFLIGGLAGVAACVLIGLGVMSLQHKRYYDELFSLNTTVLRKLDALGAHDEPPPVTIPV